MRVTEIVLGEDHPGLGDAEYILESMTRSLVLLGQGAIVSLVEDSNGEITNAQAIMLVNQMFSHFAQNTPKTTGN